MTFFGRKGEQYDKNYRKITPPPTMKMEDIDESYNFPTFQSYFQSQNAKIIEWKNATKDAILPLPPTISYCRLAPQIKKRTYQKFFPEKLPKTENISAFFNAELIPMEPLPEMYDTYEQYHDALLNWSKAQKTTIFSPIEISEKANIKLANDEPHFFHEQEIERPNIMSFSYDVSLKSFSELTVTTFSEFDESFYLDDNIVNIRHSEINNYRGKELSVEEFHKILEQDFCEISEDEKIRFFKYVDYKLREGHIETLNFIFRSTANLLKIVEICSRFSKKKIYFGNLRYHERNEIFNDEQVLIQIYNNLVDYHLIKTFSMIFSYVTNIRTQHIMQMRREASSQQMAILLLTFEKEITKWMLENAEKHPQTILLIIRIIATNGDDNVFNFKTVHIEFIKALSAVARNDEKDFNKFIFDIISDKFANIFMLDMMVNASAADIVNFPIPMYNFADSLMRIRPEVINEPCICDLSWVTTFALPMFLMFNRTHEVKILYCIKSMTGLINAICKKKGSPKEWENTVLCIAVQLTTLIQQYFTSPKFLAILILCYGDILSTPSQDMLIDGYECIKQILAAILHNNKKVSSAAFRVFRRLIMYNFKDMTSVLGLSNDSFELTSILSFANQMVACETLITLTKLLKKSIKIPGSTEKNVLLTPELCFFIKLLDNSKFNVLQWMSRTKKLVDPEIQHLKYKALELKKIVRLRPQLDTLISQIGKEKIKAKTK